eukprot:5672516-Karenia_brevis.AAC.1
MSHLDIAEILILESGGIMPTSEIQQLTTILRGAPGDSQYEYMLHWAAALDRAEHDFWMGRA